jgi:hypothetical protein
MLGERLKARSLGFADKGRALLAPLRWQRPPIARKFDFNQARKPGRQRTMRIVTEPIVRMAMENRRWVYTRIRGAPSPEA